MNKRVVFIGAAAVMVMLTAVLLVSCSGGGGGGSSAGQPTPKVQLSGTVQDGNVTHAAKEGFWSRLASFANPVRTVHAIISGPTISDIVAIGPDGTFVTASWSGNTFTLDLPKGQPYMVGLVANNSIAAIVQADLASDMDSFPISDSTTNINIGTVNYYGGLVARGTTTSTSLFNALGLTAEQAALFGFMDNSMKRLGSIDANGDGIIDSKQGLWTDLILQYVFHYNLTGSTAYSDLTGTYGDPTQIIPAGYQYTVIEMPADKIASAPTWSTAVMTFPAAVSNGTSTSTTWPACFVNPDTSGGFRTTDFLCGGGTKSPTTPPMGTYLISLGTTTLTFSNVATQTIDTNLENILFPIAKLTVVSNKVTQIDWKWMKKSGGVWSQATDGDVKALLDMHLMLICDFECSATNRVEFQVGLAATGTFTPPAQNGWDPARFDMSWIDKAGFAYALGDH